MQYWSMRTLIVSLTCLLLSACASNEITNTKKIQQQSVVEANKSNLSPEQTLQDAKSKFTDAIEAELKIFAPIHLNQAKDSISLAENSLINEPNDRKGTALMASIAAQKFIDDGYINKRIVEKNLQEVLTHNAELIKLQAPTRLSADYNDIQNQLLDLIKLIEQGQITDAIHGQPSLLLEMSKLEVQTLKHIHLSEAENLIDDAKDINGHKYAPISLKKAIDLFQQANEFIPKNYRNRKGVKEIGQRVVLAAKHAYFVALDSKNIMQLDSSESEQYILTLIDHQNNLSRIASEKELAPQSLSRSNADLLTMINDLKSQLSASQKELQNLLSGYSHPSLNTTSPTNVQEDEVVVLQTYPPISREEIVDALSEEPLEPDQSSFQADEQGFDEFEQMTSEE